MFVQVTPDTKLMGGEGKGVGMEMTNVDPYVPCD